jgi:hypothetical protein
MRKWPLVTAIILAGAAVAIAPGGNAGAESHATPKAYSPGLAEIMIATQIRHAKLWLAGDAGNWPLADYEIDELKEGLEDAVEYFPVFKDMPVGKMIEATAMPAIADVEAAIKARDRGKFTSAFDKLTAACNTCHQSANRPFIVVQRPTGSAFPNQSFAPKK